MTLDQAVRLHALGLGPIPLKERSKEPDGEWKPYQSTRATSADLHLWFGNCVRRNGGIVCGAVSGVVVLESDTAAAEAWCAENLPSTPMMTRSARGFHRYYRLPTGAWAGIEIPAFIEVDGLRIEVKRDGQYVVAPGSVHPSGHIYTEVAPWPASLDSVPELPMTQIARLAVGVARKTVEPLADIVRDGGRNSTLFREGSRLRRLGLRELEILAALGAINRNRCRPPLDEREVEGIVASCAKYERQADTYPTTETGDAEYFATLNAESVRYDHRLGQWLLFDVHNWTAQTDGEVHRLALETIRARQSAALTITNDDVRRRERLKWATGGEAHRRQANLLKLAENIKPVADAGDRWDADPWLLCTQNGVLDLRTGQLRDGRPGDRITKVAPVVFDSRATCPRWLRFVAEVFGSYPELVGYVQRALGYSLTGIITEQVFWILWGLGSNGKSTLIETFARHVMGLDDHAWTMPFPTAGWANSMTEYQKAKLAGRRLVLSSEVESRGRLNETLVKSLTGDDVVNGRNPYGEPFQFIPVAKFWTRVNHKPIIRDQSHAMWRRVKLIPFIETFSVDTQLPAALQSEASGILAWAVEGCLEWQRGGLREPNIVTEATNAYRDESRPLQQFYEERCVFDTGVSIRALQLYRTYEAWRFERRVPEVEWLNKKTFGEQIAADVRIRVEELTGRANRGVWYVGIKVRTEETDLNSGEPTPEM